MRDRIHRLEVDLQRAADKHTAIYIELLEAKAEAAKSAAAKIVKAGAKRRGQRVELPNDPTARAIVLAGAKRRGEA
jgi:hypothetical protein